MCTHRVCDPSTACNALYCTALILNILHLDRAFVIYTIDATCNKKKVYFKQTDHRNRADSSPISIFKNTIYAIATTNDTLWNQNIHWMRKTIDMVHTLTYLRFTVTLAYHIT